MGAVFKFTEEQEMIRKAAREFAEAEIALCGRMTARIYTLSSGQCLGSRSQGHLYRKPMEESV